MDMPEGNLAEREASRVRDSRAELAERLARAMPEGGTATPLAGVVLRRVDAPTELGYGVSSPAFCVIAQGSKEVLLGERRFRYDPAHYLIATATLPVASRIIEASPGRPYLSLRLDLDPALIGSAMVEAAHLAPREQVAVAAIDVSPLDADLLDAALRLVRLIDDPARARLFAPLIAREIAYRLLLGAQGGRLRQLAAVGGYTHRITRAIGRLRQNFARPLRIEELAGELGMSVSGFHHHFKAVTAMSPLQFQKHLRLQEARRLLLTDDLDAAGAGRQVGYDDPSQFTREYKRLFGAPPLRHAEQLRETAWENAGV
jgi:AraC-like DNA-binding protein